MREIVFGAEYLVLGLGDVYLGAPVAVPVDPRHRLVTTKYNPARTWTPENAVGIGGAYLCIYGMEGPGGYQFVGRTVPVWSTYGRARRTSAAEPWLLRWFDRISWYPVGADELLELRAEARAGRFEPRIDDGRFSRRVHHEFVTGHSPGIAEFRTIARGGVLRGARPLGGLGRVHPRARARRGGGRRRPRPRNAARRRVRGGGDAPRLRGPDHRRRRGDRVAPGDTVATLEAMKTESAVPCPVAGTVPRVVAEPGELVAAGTPLLVVLTDG